MKSNYNSFYNNPDWIIATVYFFTDSTLYKKIASNTIAQIISKVLTAGISIFLIGILTKYLPIELYGSYNKVYSYLGIFAFLADLGLYTLAIREISRGDIAKDKIIGNILTLRVLMALGVWGISFLIALVLPGYNDFLTLIAIGIVGAFTLVSLVNSSLLALMQSQMKMEFSLVSVVAGKIINISLVIFFLVYIFQEKSMENIAFISVFVAGFLGICLNTLMNLFYAKRICTIEFLFDWEYIRHIFKLSLPYGIALFLSVVYFKIDIILLSIIEAPELADISIALYGLPMKIVEVLMVLGGFYLNSVLPSLSEKFRGGKIEEISHILGGSLKLLLSFGVLIFTMGNIFAMDIIYTIATIDYINPVNHIYNSVQALQISLGVLLFHFVSLCFIYILIATERQSILLWINMFVAIINIAGNILIIPHYSFIGAAIITLFSQVVLMCICSTIVLKKIKIPMVYVFNMVFTIVYAVLLYFIFTYLESLLLLPGLWNILIISPMFFGIYVGGEYLVWKKIFQKLV